MTLLAVAAPIHQHTEIAPTPSTGVAPVTVSNQLGGAAILTVLAVMVATGLSAAGMRPKPTKQSSVARIQDCHHPAH